MISLNTPAIVKVPLKDDPTDRTRAYVVRLNDEVIFQGRVFIEKHQRFIEINLANILRDYTFDGQYSIEPEFNPEYGFTPQFLITRQGGIVGLVVVEILDEPNTTEYSEIYMYDTTMIPRIPGKPPATKPLLSASVRTLPRVPHLPRFPFLTTVGGDEVVLLNGKEFPLKEGPGWYSIAVMSSEIDSREDGIYLEGKGYKNMIAQCDKCPADYYVIWMVDGAFFSWGFDGTMTESSSYSKATIIDQNDQPVPYEIKSKNKYRLSSGYIDFETMKAMRYLPKSKWVILYTSKTRTFQYVNVDNTEWTCKTNKRQLYEFTAELSER